MNLLVRVFFCSLLVSFSAAGVAQVAITDAVVKQPVPGQDVSAGYFSLANLGDSPRTLVTVSAAGVERVEMHTHRHMDGMMSMVEIDQVDIPANAVLKFEPGKNHLMIFSAEDEVLKSGSMDLVFEFKNGDTVPVTASIESWQ